MNPNGIDTVYAGAMIPTDEGKSLHDLVKIALYNIDRFDDHPVRDPKVEDAPTHRQQFAMGIATIAARRGWSASQCEAVRALMKSHPPNRIYRLKGGFESKTRGLVPLGVIVTYRPAHGTPAEAAFAILGRKRGFGSPESPIAVPGEGLEDVTDAARAGTLSELRAQ